MQDYIFPILLLISIISNLAMFYLHTKSSKEQSIIFKSQDLVDYSNFKTEEVNNKNKSKIEKKDNKMIDVFSQSVKEVNNILSRKK